jgi:hypothetical protein
MLARFRLELQDERRVPKAGSERCSMDRSGRRRDDWRRPTPEQHQQPKVHSNLIGATHTLAGTVGEVFCNSASWTSASLS